MACYPLVPYSNRIGGGVLPWNGAQFQLRCNAVREGHALHGVGWQRPWTVVAASGSSAVLELQHRADADWPFDFWAQQTFAVDDAGLRMQLQMRNDDVRPAPAGLGWHPYFVKRLERVCISSRRGVGKWGRTCCRASPWPTLDSVGAAIPSRSTIASTV